MFCSQCGNHLIEGSMFCGNCGAQTAGEPEPAYDGSQQGQAGAPEPVYGDNRQIRTAAEKKGKKDGKAATTIAIALAALMILSAAAGAGYLLLRDMITPVKFADFLVERCVREALGKDWDEPVTRSEAASLKELTISSEKDATFSKDVNTAGIVYAGYVNLEDLRYLKGLESLTLDLVLKYDAIGNLDAITGCKNLKELSMPLILQGNNSSIGYMGKGYRYLAELFAKLPALEEVDFGVTIPKQLQELLSVPGRDIAFAKGEDFKEPILYGDRVSAHELQVLLRNDMEDESEVPGEDAEDVIVYVGSGDTFDCESLVDYKEIKTLVIWNGKWISQQPSKVKNLEALSELPLLSSLSLFGVSADLTDVRSLSSLRELYLCSRDGVRIEADTWKEFPALRELLIYCELSNDTFSEIWENLPELRYFFCCSGKERVEAEMFENIRQAKKLDTLVMVLSDFDGEVLEALDCPNLKNLYIDTREASGVDLKDVLLKNSLESFYYRSETNKNLDKFIETHPNLVSVSVQERWEGDADSIAANYNDAIDAAAGHAKLSLLDLSFSNMYNNAIISALQGEKLYENRIFDNGPQLGAIIQDADIPDYLQERYGE